MKYRYRPEWGSHLPLLIRVVQLSSGDILELGTGPFSTPILHWLAFDSGRKLISYENDKDYFSMHRHFITEMHTINFVEDWSKVDIERPWGVAFVDLAPAHMRADAIARLSGKADFIVAHDTEPEAERWHRYKDVFDRFKYRYDYTKGKPWTTVISNLYDIKP